MDEGSGNIAYDYSGYGNNGTLYNGTTVCGGIDACPLWVDGKFGKALSFDGIDDYVKVPDNSLPKIGTIEVWFKTTSSSGVFYSMQDKEYPIGPFDWVPVLYLKNGKLYGEYGWYGDCNETISYSTLNDSNWHHIVFGYNNSHDFMYIDGEYIGGEKISTDFLNMSKQYIGMGFADGCWGFSGWVFLNGTIDEVRIYNRALREEEIKQLYYNGLTNKFNITIGLLNFGYADLGKSFNAIVYLKNGTILQLPLVLNRDLTKGSYLENNLTIDGYYPSYGLVDKIMVCSDDCQGVCSEITVNNQC
jgi:hypothetical protein